MPWPELGQQLDRRAQQQLLRERDNWQSKTATTVTADGQELTVFCGNDYLGLAQHPEVIQATRDACALWGVGSTASHLVNGHSEQHDRLERELAEFTGRDRALLFSTGYMANLGVISALCNSEDALFQDRLNHASLLDAAKLSGARSRRYQHCNADHLNKLLVKSNARRKLVVTDGVFSMDGDLAPLPDLLNVAENHGAVLMVDDAHGFGVLGTAGAGTAEKFGLDQQQLPILMGTLGKSFGTFGAFVAGSEELINALIQFARPYVYTTALPPAVVAGSRAALRIVQREPHRRAHLCRLIDEFRHQCREHSIETLPSDTAIHPVLLGDSALALKVSEELRCRGFLVKAIRPPTVPSGSARLRITLSAALNVQDVQRFVAALSESMTASYR